MTVGKNRIGTFEGVPVYKTSAPSFIGNKHYLDDKNIYLINGELIKHNVVFGTYDGTYVEEYPISKQRSFYRYEPTKKKPVAVSDETAEPISAPDAGTAEAILASVYTTNIEDLMYVDCVG